MYPTNSISCQQLQESGRKYRKDLVRLPIIALERSTKYMTVRPGIRYEETMFSPDFNAELQPYSVAQRQQVEGGFAPRTLRTEFGACFFDFDPNQVISTILGHAASQAGEGAKNTPSAREVAASVLKNVGRSLNGNLFTAKKDHTQKKTKCLFNGFDTIVDMEIENGNISAEKGNYIKLKERLTAANAERLLKQALFAASDELREEDDAFIYCSRAISDAYNESYLLTHSGLNYNKEYKQPILEGSEFTFAPLAGKKNSKYIFFSTKRNMLVGCDQMSDTEHVEFNKYEPKVVTGELYLFFGTDFESIDPRRLLVVELYDGEDDEIIEDPVITPQEPEDPETQNS